jgi:hypothetical protein
MVINAYAENLWKELDSAWDLCVVANAYPEDIRSNFLKIWNELFCKSNIVFIDHALLKTDSDRLDVICNSIYGIYYNKKIKNWVPFRHGKIDLEKL